MNRVAWIVALSTGAALALALPLQARADEGPAGPRGDDFYAGYFRDLDGNKLAVYHIPQ